MASQRTKFQFLKITSGGVRVPLLSGRQIFLLLRALLALCLDLLGDIPVHRDRGTGSPLTVLPHIFNVHYGEVK